MRSKVAAALSIATLVCAHPDAARAQAPASRIATPAITARPAQVQTPAEAIAQDAARYADRFEVPLEEAVRRLRAQEESVAATDRLADRFADRLAGIAFQHRPEFRLLVHLTGPAPVPAESLHAGGTTVPVSFVPGAKATRDQTLWAIAYHQGKIRAALPGPPGMGVDPRTGELVVIVSRAHAARLGVEAIAAKVEALAHVPVQVRVLDRIDVNLGVQGGSRVEGVSPADGRRYVCTTGFVTTDGTRQAVSTAAHCQDTLTYIDPEAGAVPLEYVGQWGWGYQDVQLHLAPGPLRPLIYSDTAKTLARPIMHTRTRRSIRAGEFVCHRGERTGYSCSEVEMVDFAPAGDLCGGACLPTWVTAAGPTCKSGDSGAPVFGGTSAFGILKGASYRPDGSCAFYYFMSVDYLPKGWSLLLAPAQLPRASSEVAPASSSPSRP